MDATWNLPPPPGFQGLREDLPLKVYQRHLPHWRQDGATYFVTFRLADSLPKSKLRELESLRAEWKRRHRNPSGHEDMERLSRAIMRRVEVWLDEGMGSCVLHHKAASTIVAETLQSGDGVEYELGCYVVMPNHVHAIVRPLVPATLPLESILRRWKGASGCEIHRLLRQSGTLWQHETFDRLIRDEEHLWQALQYIGRNPRKAGLSLTDVPLWIRPDWVNLGWRFEPV